MTVSPVRRTAAAGEPIDLSSLIGGEVPGADAIGGGRSIGLEREHTGMSLDPTTLLKELGSGLDAHYERVAKLLAVLREQMVERMGSECAMQ